MATPTNQPQASSGEDIALISIVFVVTLALLYTIFHDQVVAVVFWVRRLEAFLCWDAERAAVVMDWINNTHPSNVTTSQLINSGAILGKVLRWPVMALLGGLCGYVLIKHPIISKKYVQKYNMDSLLRQESQRWQVTQPIIDKGLIHVPYNDPIDGLRMEPREYAYKHKMARRIIPGESLAFDPDCFLVIDNLEVLDVQRTREVLARQLGDVWKGFDALTLWEKSLFVAFAVQLRGNPEKKTTIPAFSMALPGGLKIKFGSKKVTIPSDNDIALKIINELAVAYCLSIKEKNINLLYSPTAMSLAKEYINRKAVLRIVERHAYKRTVFMSLLEACRGNGKLPPNWFRWVKTINRTTWYSLTDIGISTSSIESAGCRAHWLAEVANNGPLLNPVIESAVRGLIKDLDNFYPPEEEEDDD